MGERTTENSAVIPHWTWPLSKQRFIAHQTYLLCSKIVNEHIIPLCATARLCKLVTFSCLAVTVNKRGVVIQEKQSKISC